MPSNTTETPTVESIIERIRDYGGACVDIGGLPLKQQMQPHPEAAALLLQIERDIRAAIDGQWIEIKDGCQMPPVHSQTLLLIPWAETVDGEGSLKTLVAQGHRHSYGWYHGLTNTGDPIAWMWLPVGTKELSDATQ
jgi:hypothetical protein